MANTRVNDIKLLYSSKIGLHASSREIDINHILNHEVAPVPIAMFTETGKLRIGIIYVSSSDI